MSWLYKKDGAISFYLILVSSNENMNCLLKSNKYVLTDIFVFIFISAIDPLKMSYEYINNNVNNISNNRYILFFIKNLNKI